MAEFETEVEDAPRRFRRALEALARFDGKEGLSARPGRFGHGFLVIMRTETRCRLPGTSRLS